MPSRCGATAASSQPSALWVPSGLIAVAPRPDSRIAHTRRWVVVVVVAAPLHFVGQLVHEVRGQVIEARRVVAPNFGEQPAPPGGQ